MGSQLQKDLIGHAIDGRRDKWSRRSVRLQLDMISAFESGDLYDCTIRVGCNLQNSNSSFKVRLMPAQIGIHYHANVHTNYYMHQKGLQMPQGDPLWVQPCF
jgi:hypothetical protein